MPDSSSTTITITLNGDPHQLPGEVSVEQLVELLKMKPNRVAVELNREVILKARYAETIIRSGDVVEVINFVGGG
jgi:thiamine biosynthesis protein ThiS